MQHIITEANCEMFRQNDTWHLSGISLSGLGNGFIYLEQLSFSLLRFSIWPSQTFISLTGGHSPVTGWLACTSQMFFPAFICAAGVYQPSSQISNRIASVNTVLQSIFFFNKMVFPTLPIQQTGSLLAADSSVLRAQPLLFLFYHPLPYRFLGRGQRRLLCPCTSK